MEKVEPRTLAGFMELLPNDQILFNQIMNTIEETYQRFGFLPLDTPIIELSEVFRSSDARSIRRELMYCIGGIPTDLRKYLIK